MMMMPQRVQFVISSAVQVLSIVTALAGGFQLMYPNTVASPTELQMYKFY